MRKPQTGLGFLTSAEWPPMCYWELTQFLRAPTAGMKQVLLFIRSSRSGGFGLPGWLKTQPYHSESFLLTVSTHACIWERGDGPSWAAGLRADLLTSLHPELSSEFSFSLSHAIRQFPIPYLSPCLTLNSWLIQAPHPPDLNTWPPTGFCFQVVPKLQSPSSMSRVLSTLAGVV